MIRASWDTYFLDIAKTVATRGTCTRKKVGAVLVSADRHIISTGYNGSTPGAPHCDEVGCMMENDRCIRTIHSEVNAIAQAARHGVAVVGSSAYVTASPCWPCFKVLSVSGIRRIVFGEKFYRDVERIQEAAMGAKIELVDFSTGKIVTNPCTRCNKPILKGLRYCNSCLVKELAENHGHEVPTESDITEAKRHAANALRFIAREPDGRELVRNIAKQEIVDGTSPEDYANIMTCRAALIWCEECEMPEGTMHLASCSRGKLSGEQVIVQAAAAQDGYVKVAKWDGTFEWVKPEK
jgi:dCMP deaminase